jgi:hypothetical protein
MLEVDCRRFVDEGQVGVGRSKLGMTIQLVNGYFLDELAG